MKVELEKAKTQIETSEKVTELLILARAFRSWRFWLHALEYYEMAIEMQPDNPDIYVQNRLFMPAKPKKRPIKSSIPPLITIRLSN